MCRWLLSSIFEYKPLHFLSSFIVFVGGLLIKPETLNAKHSPAYALESPSVSAKILNLNLNHFSTNYKPFFCHSLRCRVGHACAVFHGIWVCNKKMWT